MSVLTKKHLGILATLALVPTAALAKKGHKAHEHGVIKLSVAMDGNKVEITGEIPGDDAFGFEHDARNDQQKKAITDALATLRTKGTELFVFPADAGCTVKSADIKAPMEASTKPGFKPAPPKAGGKEEHQDVDADYAFTCQKSPAGGTLKLGIMKAFPHIRTAHVQIVGGSAAAGASEAEVHSADEEIKL